MANKTRDHCRTTCGWEWTIYEVVLSGPHGLTGHRSSSLRAGFFVSKLKLT